LQVTFLTGEKYLTEKLWYFWSNTEDLLLILRSSNCRKTEKQFNPTYAVGAMK